MNDEDFDKIWAVGLLADLWDESTPLVRLFLVGGFVLIVGGLGLIAITLLFL